MLPLGSGCHYNSNFESSPLPQDLVYERLKLDAFRKSGNFDQHIFWYRKRFDTRFQDVFNYSIEDINQVHWEYIQLNPSDLNEQLKHIDYLMEKNHQKLAQNNIDEYCERFVPKYRNDLIHNIEKRLAKYQTQGQLDLQSCELTG